MQKLVGKFIVILCLLLCASCNNARHIAQHQQLLIKNKVTIIDSIDYGDERDLDYGISSQIIQKPNSLFLGMFRWLKFDTIATAERGLSKTIKRRFAEDPIFLDRDKTDESLDQIEKYLRNKGYFHAEVHSEIFYPKKDSNQIGINYVIRKNMLTRIRDIHYDMFARLNRTIIKHDSKSNLKKIEETKLRVGHPYDGDVLKQERSRITTILNQKGFHKLNKQAIFFDVDTLDGTGDIDVFVRSASKIKNWNRTHRINEVHIYLEGLNRDKKATQLDTFHINEYYFFGKFLRYNPKVITQSILFRRNKHFNAQDHQNTFNQLSLLHPFKFVNIGYEEIEIGGKPYLNVIIDLTPDKRQGFSVELETSTAGDYFLGSDVKASYNNKNLFRQADLFTLSGLAGIETRVANPNGLQASAFEYSLNANSQIPKLVLPNFATKWLRSLYGQTTIDLELGHFRQVDLFNINSASGKFGYKLKDLQGRTLTINPLEITLTSLGDTTAAFNQKLVNDPLLAKSLGNQLILGSSAGYTMQKTPVLHPSISYFFRGKIDVAGNMLALLYGVNNEDATSSFLPEFAQYVKPELEVRVYKNLNNKKVAWVNRALLGVGYAYGNSEVMPFIKQYTAGGSNSLRAWPMRLVGPGTFNTFATGTSENSRLFEQTGDMKIELNSELRFDLISFIKGAFFLDAGNIWLVRENESKPGASFRLDSFGEQLAVGAGIGARLDFEYLIVRLDYGIKIHDPAQPLNEPWPYRQLFDSEWKTAYQNEFNRKFKFTQLNLGIGYPF